MIGLVAYRGEGAPPLVIGGVRFCGAFVRRGVSLRAKLSALAAARALARAGVRRAVFPRDYPFLELFLRRGVVPVCTAPLYRATAADIVRVYLAQRGTTPRETPLTLAAERVTPELRHAAELLASETRRLTVAAAGGETLARELLRRHGVVLLLADPAAPPGEGLCVVFDALPARSEALRLDETLRVAYAGAPPAPLLAAVWSAGAVNADALRAEKVEVE